ncbi:Vacuolar protein sorting-associated protein 41 [Knufia fluminis]|uniref:Vacuolar protein sorting-associated protein 41 n=1 Tax=Knufia fluminis TaxID=191047 RepID=A0AAN8EP09_9EURO|nr:Vacuolar protein sorting-associated protein 41 [Knufia fluminis]
MAAGEGSSEPDEDTTLTPQFVEPKPEETQPTTPHHSDHEDDHNGNEHEEEEESEEEDEDDEEEEPRLKYAPLTKNLGGVYRNGDATSSFFVAGDKLIIGTHNGNVHVYSMPMMQNVKSYRAHTASVSSVSISPFPPPLPFPTKLDAAQRLAAESADARSASPSASPNAKSSPRQASLARLPSNDIYVATSSIDGHVCVQSLLDPKDVQLRNFGRPVQAVALSPDFKSDKTYLSGGQAGSLVLTVGGQSGKSTNASTTGTAAAASGWLGSIGLGGHTGTDKVLHSGEGIISTIKWSLSGKYVLWVNEQGIKIARSHLKLENAENGLEWKRISHVSRPNRSGWEELAAVQRARAEWVDRSSLDSDEDPALRHASSNGGIKASDQSGIEEVVVGWGDVTWIIRVYPGDGGSMTKDAAPAGRAEVISVIRHPDCMIAGVSLYTPTLVLILAYMEKKSTKPKKSDDSTPRSRSKRHNALKPELRLIDINTHEEIETDSLPVSRFESLASSDYHLGVLYPIKIPAQLAQRGYLGQVGSGMAAVGSGLVTGTEVVAQGMWDATMYGPRMLGANKLFTSETGSIRSGRIGTDKSPGPAAKSGNYLTGWIPGLGSSVFGNDNEELKAVATTQGMKIFLMSPYDCIVAVKRNLTDRIQWLEKQEQYQKAWELLDEHPEAAGSTAEPSEASSPPTPSKTSSMVQSTTDSVASPSRQVQKPTLAEFFADSASMLGSARIVEKDRHSTAEKEKRRIGELWLQQLTKAAKWSEAGEIAGKVLNTTTRWEHWAWVFIRNKKIDEISPYIPAMELTPPLSPSIFEVVLGHYVSRDRKRFQELIDVWPSDLFEISSVVSAVREQLSSGDVKKESDDWRRLEECLAKLYLADGHYREALKCYIQLQDAETAMSLVKDHHLVEAIVDDIPGFVLLRIGRQQIKTSSRDDLEDAASEPIKLLVDEASLGVVDPDNVVEQLDKPDLRIFLFFYLKHLWQGTGHGSAKTSSGQRHRFSTAHLAADEGKLLVDRYPELAVELFAEYDRGLLMDFLQTSTLYDFSTALKVCEKRKYVEEEVYLLSKTGSLKKALYLIIDELQDVSKAISFAKEQDDKGLWNDLLDYSMSRPSFISGLLAEVGTAIDPITLIRRIPSGIEIVGLKEGLKKMLREYDLQDSISSGAARILSSEVAVNMEVLRRGRRRGIKFDVPVAPRKVVKDDSQAENTAMPEAMHEGVKPGHCARCDKAFTGEESEMLVGFACGHVYHVGCLFKDESKAPLPTRDDGEEDELGYGFTRSIATKVTNARLLRDRIKLAGGCKVCRTRQRQIDDVLQ